MDKPKSLSAFAKNLRELRNEKRLSQDDLGKAVGVSRGSISFYENDDRIPDMEILKNIKKFFNVDYSYLFGETTYKHTEEKNSLEGAAKQLTEKAKIIDPKQSAESIEILEAIFGICSDESIKDIIFSCLNTALLSIFNILLDYRFRYELQTDKDTALTIQRNHTELQFLLAKNQNADGTYNVRMPKEQIEMFLKLKDKKLLSLFLNNYIKTFSLEAQNETLQTHDAFTKMIEELQNILNTTMERSNDNG